MPYEKVTKGKDKGKYKATGGKMKGKVMRKEQVAAIEIAKKKKKGR